MCNDKVFYEIFEEQQEKYFNRIEEMNKRFTRTINIITICVSLLVAFWFYNYFHTPYLTKNYNNVNNNGTIDNYKGGE